MTSSTRARSISTLIFSTVLLASLGCADGGNGDDSAGTEDGDDTSDEGETADTSDSGDPIAQLPAPELPDALLDYSHDLPEHFLEPALDNFDNTPDGNPVTDAGATLGRVLFWDRRLSLNGAVACGSCHSPDAGFTDEAILSEGFEGALTGRHSMPLINLRWYARGSMFWDERAATLEDQVLMPIQDPGEMGLTLETLVERVSEADYYGPLFEAAFGDDEVTSDRISLALAQFLRSIVSYRSPWDEGVAAVGGDITQAFPNFSAEENLGKDVFFGQVPGVPPGLCGNCHLFMNPLGPQPPGAPPPTNVAIFYGPVPTNNGLLDDEDEGVGGVTGNAADAGRFKSPSLRNVAETGPYMHDGRFATLEEVVEHYDDGVEAHPNLDPILIDPMTMMPARLNLSADERAALVAFLGTLSDDSLASDPRWHDPFPG